MMYIYGHNDYMFHSSYSKVIIVSLQMNFENKEKA